LLLDKPKAGTEVTFGCNDFDDEEKLAFDVLHQWRTQRLPGKGRRGFMESRTV